MRSKRTLFALVVVVALGLIWYWLRSGGGVPEPSSVVEEDVLESTFVSASGTVSPARQGKLGFVRMARLKSLKVQVGDTVRAGQAIAELEAADLQADVEVAQEALNLARAQLAQLEAGSRPEAVEEARASFTGAQARLDQVLAGATEADLEAAAAALEAAKERQSQAEASASTQEKIAEARLDAARARLDQLLAGPSARDVRAAELQLEQARNSLWATQIERDGLKGNRANPEFMGKAGDAKVAAAETAVKIAETSLLKLREGPTPEEVRAARAVVAQAEAELAAVQQTKEAALQSAASAVRSAEVRLAQLSRGPTAQERDIAASNVAGAKSALDLRSSGPVEQDLEVARARVRQAERALERARAELELAALAAPFPGVVAAVLVNEGEVVSLGATVVVVGDISQLRIETSDLRETSVARVRLGQPVEVTFDALPEKTVQGKVNRIAPMATTGAGGTNYTVLIELDQQDPALRWGMTANVTIDVR